MKPADVPVQWDSSLAQHRWGKQDGGFKVGVECSLSQLLMCPTLCPAFSDRSPVVWALPASWPCGLVLRGVGVLGVVGPESAWVQLGTPFVVRAGTWVLSLCAGHTVRAWLACVPLLSEFICSPLWTVVAVWLECGSGWCWREAACGWFNLLP